MPAYLVTGASGSGKSTLGQSLIASGYAVVDSDEAFSQWVDTATGRPVPTPPPPYGQQWLDTHTWQWDPAKVTAALKRRGPTELFICGGAHNESDFYPLFRHIFVMSVAADTMVRRLRQREPGRWRTGSAELTRMVDWHAGRESQAQQPGFIRIDGNQPPEAVLDEVLGHVR